MYHNVSLRHPGLTDERSAFDVSQRLFEQQLDMIGDLGFTGCAVRTALADSRADRVGITFDDGDAGQFDHALSALAARKMTATFFVTTSWVGTTGFVSWSQLREMKAAGMSIQSHTHSHPFLVELSEADVVEELRVSKDRLDQELGQNTNEISLPNGDFPRRPVRSLLAEIGYQLVGTSRWGANPVDGSVSGTDSPVFVRRCTIRGAAPIGYFKQVLSGDPWLAVRRRLRYGLLRAVRTTLRPSRYARWRRRLLNAAA